jgi:hypothetical protein
MDLVPVLNLVAMLVPFMLLSAGLAERAAVDVQAEPPPGDGEGEGVRAPVVVEIGRSGYRVVVSEPAGDVATVLGCIDGACQDLDAFDEVALVAELRRLRAASPSRRSLLLAPELWVPYEVVIRTMDLARGPGEAGTPLFAEVTVAGGRP